MSLRAILKHLSDGDFEELVKTSSGSKLAFFDPTKSLGIVRNTVIQTGHVFVGKAQRN